MKRYVKQSTNTVHYIADIRRENPNVSIPDDADCSDFGYEFLVETAAPQQDGFDARELSPIDNVQQWELVPRPIVVPYSITARQARLVLLGAGLLDEIEALLATNRAYQIEWEYAAVLERGHPLIAAMADQMGLSGAQVDQLFIDGAKL